MAVKLSVIVSARYDSKYLAKFLFGYFARTADLNNTEILVMMNEHDKWNEELVNHFIQQPYNVKFYREDHRLGRAGLHVYFNDLLKYTTGDWVVYFCEDHFIVKDSWDQKVRQVINRFELDPKMIYSIIPKFDNVGAMNQVVSKGFINVMGGVIGRHGWIDSYINDLNEMAFGKFSDRVIRMDEEIFHDFSHDKPDPMSKGAQQSPVGLDGSVKDLPKHNSEEYKQLVFEDAMKFKTALEGGL